MAPYLLISKTGSHPNNLLSPWTGTNMKIFSISIILAVVLAFGYIASESRFFQVSDSVPKLTIQEAVPAGVSPKAITDNQDAVRDSSIFSWSTIVTLSVAVIGIVAFRRNTYS